ncbi:hypothetical protein DFO66_11242 [Brevibacterium sanguinis]|uniref:Uncharacterized protein n=2 Tax=Brevibacterium TaxID=1696 RepID=A0A366IFU0_9MICO|nr:MULTISPECIES: DUF6270 domain-containing protein [Brevibacterium]RBP62938.1 hypothetical protein DFO66_11242 [Brevibacterium sanguinis]RBP69517.1 hypothetical protein DFO65_11251 [Brevibacterium celere]
MKIAIFGSCVSRDTCEFIPNSEVVSYVARQSVTSLDSPHGTQGVNVSGLSSPFQRRMVLSDLKGDGLLRITQNAAELDLVLIDLVDERRGYWLWPDGTTMTNSLEVEACGAGAIAEDQGARLIEFGTDEHFLGWRRGFEILIQKLRIHDLLDKTVFLDIEWACAIAGSHHPRGDTYSKIGRRWRRTQRGTREAVRRLAQGSGLNEALRQVLNVKPTDAEEFAERAKKANELYVRYRKIVSAAVTARVTRSSATVRIEPTHKWGPQPFHYREEDYRSIVNNLNTIMTSWTEKDEK